MEMMKAHKYNVEHRLKYDNQERILYRHHFNYYPVKRPRPRKTSLDPNWYTENIYSNQSIDNSDAEHAGMGTAFGGSSAPPDRHRDINGNVRLSALEDDGIFTIDGHLERRSNYPKSSSCCFATTNRMWDIEEGDGLELDDWHERYPKIPKSYSFSTSRSMGVGFNMAKLYNRNSFEMPEFPSHRRRPTPAATASSEGAGRDPRTILRMCDREGCFNETCFSKDEKNFYNNQNNHHHHHHHHHHNQHNNSNIINNNNVGNNNNNNSNIISEWNLRNRNNLRVRAEPSVAGPRAQYVMEEDFDLFEDEDEDEVDEVEEEDEEEESDLNTLYAEDRHSIAYGDYGRVARDFCPRTPSGRVDELFRAERSKQLLRSKFDRVAKYSDDFTDDYRKSFEDFFNQNCCIERHHGQLKDSGRFFNKPPVVVKNKSMLEVKPPNRFDDSSSGSTDLELDDFNFDFEKYWEELEKPSPTSPSELEERYGGKEGRSALAAPGGRSGKKVKNVNLSRCYNNGTVIDIYHDDDPYHRDHYHYREGGLHGASKATNHAHNANNNSGQFRLAHQFGHANTTPRSKGSRHKVYPAAGGRELTRPDEGDEDGLLDGATRKSGPPGGLGRSLDPSAGISNNSNAISFLNNIFSIYKPNKYSPLNCHVEQNYLKNIPAKKMNIVASSAARPLGARGAEAAASDTSSTKRPLTVHPSKAQPGTASSAGAARRSARPPASTKDPQARFQIIPDKTGVKISPLYRLDAQDYRRARYKLKSTSRPLSFW